MGNECPGRDVIAEWSKSVRGEEARWADWMRAANAGDSKAYLRLLEVLTPFLPMVVRQGFTGAGLGGSAAGENGCPQ